MKREALLKGPLGEGPLMGLSFVVGEGDWGGTQPDNIVTLLKDVASHLTQLIREPFIGIIEVAPTKSLDDDPITLYRSSSEAPYQILLQARGKYWSQFAYQFAHELCHVLSNYERLRDNPNNWFHEALCELAAVFTLRRMAEHWRTNPPYPGRTDYAESLASYVGNRLSHEKHQLPTGTTLPAWLLSEEESLRQDRYQRAKNAVVAYSLLPIFESEPTGWNAIRSLPDSSAMFKEYLHDWHSQVESIDKPFVNWIIQLSNSTNFLSDMKSSSDALGSDVLIAGVFTKKPIRPQYVTARYR